MKILTSHAILRGFAVIAVLVLLFVGEQLRADAQAAFDGSIVLGRPTDTSVTANILANHDTEIHLEYSIQSGTYITQTSTYTLSMGVPVEVLIDELQPNTKYYYRMGFFDDQGVSQFTGEYSFHTQRAPGSTFSFGIQGDSHPERRLQFDPALYPVTLQQAAADQLDFYILLGDDFSVDRLDPVGISSMDIEDLYLSQRPYLNIVGSSAPVFLVNGNHEQAALYLYDGTADNVAVWAQNSRNQYYAQPAPDGFYTGNSQIYEHIGLLRNYYAWTWGDALFIVLDPYWSSPVPVNNRFGGGGPALDRWEITLGDTQYAWLKSTLESSTTTYKFVIAHHLHGPGGARIIHHGGINIAHLYEWGGHNEDGSWGFATERPDWDLPIHDLLVENEVDIFFQGHDHIWVKEELDGVVYQTLSQPANSNYAFDNEDRFDSDFEFPNSGYTRVTVMADTVTVEYVRTYLPEDETPDQQSGEVAFSYIVLADDDPTGDIPCFPLDPFCVTPEAPTDISLQTLFVSSAPEIAPVTAGLLIVSAVILIGLFSSRLGNRE